jgi:hypothetical protein
MGASWTTYATGGAPGAAAVATSAHVTVAADGLTDVIETAGRGGSTALSKPQEALVPDAVPVPVELADTRKLPPDGVPVAAAQPIHIGSQWAPATTLLLIATAAAGFCCSHAVEFAALVTWVASVQLGARPRPEIATGSTRIADGMTAELGSPSMRTSPLSSAHAAASCTSASVSGSGLGPQLGVLCKRNRAHGTSSSLAFRAGGALWQRLKPGAAGVPLQLNAPVSLCC